jgi:hypothetical protein
MWCVVGKGKGATEKIAPLPFYKFRQRTIDKSHIQEIL